MNRSTAFAVVGKPMIAAESSASDGPVTINRITYQAAPDELRPITGIAKEWNVEPSGLLRAAQRAGIAVRIGRQWCARRSDLLRLPELLAKPAPDPTSHDPRTAYDSLVGKKAGSR